MDTNELIKKYNLRTGDILLFDNKSKNCFGFFTDVIKLVTKSPFSHVAMVLIDPIYIDPKLKGLFIWESSIEKEPDPQDGKKKLGVQITPFQEIYDEYQKTNSKIVLRKLHARHGLISNQKLLDIHKVVYDKPYDLDINDWVQEIIGKDKHPQKTDRFWCSALVGYIYSKLGIIDPATDWSFLRASDFSIKYNGKIKFINGCRLVDEQIQIL